MVFGAGEMVEQIGKLVVANQPQIERNPRAQHDARFGLATARDRRYQRMRQQCLHHWSAVIQVVDAADDVYVANDLLATADAARHLEPDDLWQRAQDGGYCLSLGLGLREECVVLVARQKIQPLEDVLLAPGSESRQCGDLTRFGGGFQVIERGDAEGFVNLADALRPEAGDPRHLPQSSGNARE